MVGTNRAVKLYLQQPPRTFDSPPQDGHCLPTRPNCPHTVTCLMIKVSQKIPTLWPFFGTFEGWVVEKGAFKICLFICLFVCEWY